MPDADITSELQSHVRDAAARGQALRLRGANTKAFYGREAAGEPLDLSAHSGIVDYEPTELVLTARAGTPIREIETLLGQSGQMLSFEPPQFSADTNLGEASGGALGGTLDGILDGTLGGTLGGAIASGLGGPRRPWGGAPRDLLLGVKLLDGSAQVMSFGGQVMKNVAGYDVSRLMAGALGTLGVLLEISIKVLPRPPVERTLVLEKDRDTAVALMREYANKPASLSGACHADGRLYLRLTGNQAGVDEWAARIGGEPADNDFWVALRDQRLDFFQEARPLWRLSLPPATPRLHCEQSVITDWAGGQRWVHTEDPAAQIRNQVATYGGHATLFRHGDRGSEVFQPLDPIRQRLHQGLKQTFDPKGIFNPGRLYADL